jgi:hypothetical protein
MRRKGTPPGRAAAEGAKQAKTGNIRPIPQISGSAKIGRSLAAQAKEARRTAAHIGAYTGEAFRPFEPKPVPGRMRPDGTWVRVPLSERMTPGRVKAAQRAGAHVGLLAAAYPALHIDVGIPLLVAEVETLAFGILGPAPVRTRPDVPSVLLMYRGEDGSRFPFRTRAHTRSSGWAPVRFTSQTAALQTERRTGGAASIRSTPASPACRW